LEIWALGNREFIYEGRQPAFALLRRAMKHQKGAQIINSLLEVFIRFFPRKHSDAGTGRHGHGMALG
jgi:hypothetical protein